MMPPITAKNISTVTVVTCVATRMRDSRPSRRDPERAFPQWNHIDPDSASEIAAFAIDDAKVGNRQLFRPGLLNARPMIVTKALAEKLKGFEGVSIDTLKR